MGAFSLTLLRGNLKPKDSRLLGGPWDVVVSPKVSYPAYNYTSS